MNQYRDIAITYFDTLLNQKDISICDKLLASDYTDNDAPEGTLPGPDETKNYVKRLLRDYPDMSITVLDSIAEGQKVVLRIIWYGHHNKTGERFRKMGNLILLFNDKGQIKKRWSCYTDLR